MSAVARGIAIAADRLLGSPQDDADARAEARHYERLRYENRVGRTVSPEKSAARVQVWRVAKATEKERAAVRRAALAELRAATARMKGETT